MSESATGDKSETEAPMPSADLNLDSLDDMSGGGVTITADIAHAQDDVSGSA